MGVAGLSREAGAKRPIARVKRAYPNFELRNRVEKLTFDIDHPSVRAAAERAHAHFTKLFAGRQWVPEATTIARLLGALHTGVKLSVDHPTWGPIVDWELSIKQWSERLQISESTFCYLMQLLGSGTILLPGSQRAGAPQALASGLGWVESEARNAPMRIWWANKPGAPPQRGENPSDPHDCIIELRGPSVRRLTPAGLAALGLPEDWIAVLRQKKAERKRPPTEAELAGAKERAQQRAKQAKPNKQRGRTVLHEAALTERFGNRIATQAQSLVRIENSAPSAPVGDRELAAILGKHTNSSHIAAANRAEAFARDWVAQVSRELGRPLAPLEHTCIFDLAFEKAYAALTALCKPPNSS